MVLVIVLVVQFDYSGCSDQHQSLLSLYNLKQYTSKMNPVNLQVAPYIIYICIHPTTTDQNVLIL